MKAGGQKQEVRFLAMTIGALVVAVALFVGVRALSSRSAAAPATAKPRSTKAAKATKPEAKKKKEEAKALPASSRDPFLSAAGAPVTSRGASAREVSPLMSPRGVRPGPGPNAPPVELDASNLRLAGIMHGGSAMALIHVGDQRFYAQLGDQVGGFKLVKIGTNSVVLAAGTQYVTLTIQPEPGSGGRGPSRTRTVRRR